MAHREALSGVELRDIRDEDVPTVLALNEAATPAVSHETLEEIERFARRCAYFRVAEKDGELVGFLVGMLPDMPYDSMNFLWFRQRYDSFAYVDRIVIGEATRGRGLGRLFYENFEAFARERSIPLLTCEVNIRPRNDVSLDFHASYGFEVVGQQDTEGGEKTVSMMKKDVR